MAERRWRVTSVEDEFVVFAEAASPRLRRTAFLLCGDWHMAEDLAQTALAKVFVAWRRIARQDAVQAYAQRTLLNTYLADRRLKRPAEVLTSRLPDRPSRSPEPEQRLVVLDALATLPPKARAVVVLRYWADLSVEQVADLLGCSTGNVKSQSARALDKLRPLLSEAARPASAAADGRTGSSERARRENRSGRDG
jgi:RNA polymerase sigma-70 factor (sigma-E family)